jgi:putative PIN family toxin of toxin-antitoxin system
MRVVLDTNVMARAALPRGPAIQLLQRLRRPPHEFLTSEFILSELGRALRYPRLQAYHGLTDEPIATYVAGLRQGAMLVELPENVPMIATDPDDDRVIATTVLGAADVLCTWDRHFFAPNVLAYLDAFGVRVLRDVDLIAQLDAEGE